MTANGLSDGQQSILALVSIMLAALGGLSIPAGAPWYVGLCISAFGALGMAVKEVLGTKDGQQKQQQQASTPTTAAPAVTALRQAQAVNYDGMSDFDIFKLFDAQAKKDGKTLVSVDTIRDASGIVQRVTPHYLGEVATKTTA